MNGIISGLAKLAENAVKSVKYLAARISLANRAWWHIIWSSDPDGQTYVAVPITSNGVVPGKAAKVGRKTQRRTTKNVSGGSGNYMAKKRKTTRGR